MIKFEKIIIKVMFILLLVGCASKNQTIPQNNAVPKSCRSIYHNYSSKNLCDIYWENKNPFCDYDLRIILSDRGQSITPRTNCGQPIKSSNINSCNLTNINQLTPLNLCNAYYSTNNCNTEIRNEFTRRNLRSTPQRDCGTILNTNSIKQIVKVDSKNKQCLKYLNELYSNISPINAACTERYKSIRDETIICRQDLNSFIIANSKGVGKSYATCGIQDN